MTAPARVAAFHALRGVENGSSDLPSALARSRQHLPDDRDRALTADIVTGTLRWQRSVDHLIAEFAKRPLARLDAEVVTILRLSLYQLLHLTRVPASAVVDDAVDMTRAARKPSAAGFVNAVLRSTIRQKHRLPLPPRPEDPADRAAAVAYLGITHSHPEWLVGRWLDRYGFDAVEQWVRFNNDAPRLTLRVNLLKATRDEATRILEEEGIETEPTPIAPEGLTVLAGNPMRRAPDGLFVVQDEASQLVAMTAAARPGERVLDLCAAPGGKTTAMIADMNDEGLLVATDVRPRRMRLLHETVRLSGARRAHVVQVPGRGELPFGAAFDCVLVDAPCSGLGTIRRDPDIRWRRSEADLERFAQDQVDLLARAATTVRPHGRLVYSTCSSEPDENENVVSRFLESNSQFELVPLVDPRLRELITGTGVLRTLPFAHRLEAFFAAVLVRRSPSADPADEGVGVR
jgi:16S rRNA (cytosine967-C5)-methyltransferase